MNVVDITETNPAFFIVSAIFIMFIMSMFSLSVLRFFQGFKKQGFVFIGVGLVGVVAFVAVVTSGAVSL